MTHLMTHFQSIKAVRESLRGLRGEIAGSCGFFFRNRQETQETLKTLGAYEASKCQVNIRKQRIYNNAKAFKRSKREQTKEAV